MAIRVLDVLNFSNARNPAADSGVRLQRELIQTLSSRRPDFFFYLLVPWEAEKDLIQMFAFRNVKVIACSCLSRQRGGAYHFDVREISELLDLSKVDIDFLFINQPELTSAFLHYFNKVNFFDIHSVGYIHWMDWRRYDNVKNRWNLPTNLAILTSILISAVTGCNSEYGKRRILDHAARFFNKKTLDEIAAKLIVLRPGINTREILEARTSGRNRIKTLIAPYRAQKYTGFKSLIEVHLARLWRRRQDFRLVLTNPSAYDYVRNYSIRFPFIEIQELDRSEYLKALWTADIVVGPHPGASQWSLAVVEALAAGCVPLLNQESFFKEMLLDVLPLGGRTEAWKRYFYYRQTFCQKLEYLLDNLPAEKRRFSSIAARIRAVYDWNHRIDDWIEAFEAADDASQQLVDVTSITRKIDRLLQSNGSCSKQMILRHLQWHPKSRYISWTRYRKYLRHTYCEEPDLPQVVFKKQQKTHVRPAC